MMTNVNQAYKYYTIIFIVSLPLPKDVKVMISMNIDAQTFYKYFVSLHNKSTRPKRVSPLVKKKSGDKVTCPEVIKIDLTKH